MLYPCLCIGASWSRCAKLDHFYILRYQRGPCDQEADDEPKLELIHESHVVDVGRHAQGSSTLQEGWDLVVVVVRLRLLQWVWWFAYSVCSIVGEKAARVHCQAGPYLPGRGSAGSVCCVRESEGERAGGVCLRTSACKTLPRKPAHQRSSDRILRRSLQLCQHQLVSAGTRGARREAGALCGFGSYPG